MTTWPMPQHGEEMRLRRLVQLELLDTQAESVLDRFTELAAAATGLPLAVVALVDDYREWWKSAVGLPQGGTAPRDQSLCAQVIAQPGTFFEVEDARRDPRFCRSLLVREEPHVVHYAAAVLEMPTGERVGTLAVMERRPGRLPPYACGLLVGLARTLVQVLLLREREHQAVASAQGVALVRESEARLHMIADAVPQIVWCALPDGQVDYYNQRWWEYTGLPVGSTLGADWKTPVHPEDRLALLERWMYSVRTGEPFEAEYRLRHHSGDFRWVLTRAMAVRGAHGEVLRWIGTGTDIEQQKRYLGELQLADRRKDEFLAMLAHELRGPLAPITTAASTLALAPEDAERVRRSAELIARQARHMGSLLGELMDVSRVSRGMVELRREPLVLQALVQQAVEQVGPAMQAQQQELQLSLAPRPVWIDGDRTRLVQVITNLLGNSNRYTPTGGHIGLTHDLDHGCARLCVHDDGLGIEPELLPHVFEPFRRGQRVPRRGEGGLGLGLALVRSLVALHGGRVSAFSEGPGRGSRFCVWLPLGREPPPRPQASRPPAAAPPGRLRVMVVDDNADAGSALGSWLETQGHIARVEADPWGALERSRREPADVYLLDIGLPGMDGYELARRLRAQPGAREALLVALTGHGQPEDLARARQAGFDRHIVKPPDTEEMAQVLAEARRGR